MISLTAVQKYFGCYSVRLSGANRHSSASRFAAGSAASVDNFPCHQASCRGWPVTCDSVHLDASEIDAVVAHGQRSLRRLCGWKRT